MDANSFNEYEEFEDINNVINIDGTQAIFMDGRFYIPTNAQAILLPENDNQYVLSDTGDILLSDSNFETILDNTGIVHYINNIQSKEDQNQVIYLAGGIEESTEMIEDESKLELMENNEPVLKKVKLEGGLINIDALLGNFDDNAVAEESSEMKNYQYIVELENCDGFQNSQDSFLENAIQNSWSKSKSADEESLKSVDISKITGKNLLTGQTVTLDSYLEKVRNANKELTLQKAEEISKSIRGKGQHTALTNLLNKKLTIGKTSTGQRLVGKVIHIGKKETEVADAPCLIGGESDEAMQEENGGVSPMGNYETIVEQIPETDTPEDNQMADTTSISIGAPDDTMAFVETELESADSCRREDPKEAPPGGNQTMLEYVTRTLTNLMGMETVSKKLKRKNLSIKVTERVVKDDRVKVNMFQMVGHLELQRGSEEEEDYEEKWLFKLDGEEEDKGERVRSNNKSFKKFLETMRISISIVQMDGVIQSTKVNLSTCQERCPLCSKQFRTIYKLKSHMKLVHHVVDNQFYCQLCDESLENKDVFAQHRLYHVERKELFPCPKCDKHFLSEAKMTKHAANHDPDAWKLTCKICGQAFTRTSSWRKHALTHAGVKPHSCTRCFKQFATLGDLNYHSRVHDPKNCYVCDVCNRSFSRYSNLQRHSEIHGAKNSVSVFSCSMCGCTYNYVSSLTRHIVQNHISES